MLRGLTLKLIELRKANPGGGEALKHMVEALKIIASRFNLKAPDLEGIVEA